VPNFTDLTREQLRDPNLTCGQIVSEVAKYLNCKPKREVVELLLDATTFSRPPTLTLTREGQVARREVVTEDVLGTKTGSTVITNSYFETGAIENIIIIKRDAHDVEISRIGFRHFQDGRPPVRIQAWLNGRS